MSCVMDAEKVANDERFTVEAKFYQKLANGKIK